MISRRDYLIRLKGRILRPALKPRGYLFVGLRKNNRTELCYVHRLVAKAFIPNPLNLGYINHKDRNPSNNSVTNLEWYTQQYNVTYLDADKKRGEKFKKAVLAFYPDGSLMGEFSSCKEVATALGVWVDTVHRYMAGKHKCKFGYTFKYKDSKYEPRTKPCTL